MNLKWTRREPLLEANMETKAKAETYRPQNLNGDNFVLIFEADTGSHITQRNKLWKYHFLRSFSPTQFILETSPTLVQLIKL